MSGSPAACSGAMYAGVPIDVPSCVSVDPCAPLSVRESLNALAMPKSVTTAVPPESSTLSGLMSRCTMPRSCAYCERARDVAEDAQDVGDRERRLLGQPRAQRLALDERHRVVRQAVRVARREHGNDVRLLERRRRADLALEPLGADAGGELGRQDLDDDLASEPRLVGDEDARHPAAAELALERVGSTQRRLELGLKVRHGGESTSGG